MANRFFTILIIPEKTSQVRRLILPTWLVRSSVIGAFFAIVLGGIMLLDYWYVMTQIDENKQLKIENRRLRQQVQIFRNKMTTVENTLERIKTFTTRLKVITDIKDRDDLLQTLNQKKLPDASTNIGLVATKAVEPLADINSLTAVLDPAALQEDSPENTLLRREYEELDNQISELNHAALIEEQSVQDLYELLADQKAFLAARPTRKPAVGYFTSGFGVRKSPTGDRIKMHEGLDIANHPGTPIKAPAEGIVVFANTKPGYGQTVIIDHGYRLETWYAHTRKILVSKGQKVRRGDPIALLGNSGRSTGPHLHYEVRINGTPVDPMDYILEN